MLPTAAEAAHDLARLFLVGERPADEDEEHEVDRGDARRIEIAELLADLAIDLERRDGQSEGPADLEERGLRREVRSLGRHS